MDLGKHVVDKELMDRRERRAGKVDDLLLRVEPAAGEASSLAVVAIISGPLALGRCLPGPVTWLARQVYRLLGLRDPRPVTVPWERVVKIDVVVHLDITREEAGMTALADAVNRRLIGRLPGA